RYLDLIDNNIDIAIRTREFEPDSNITIRRLAETRRILAASPGYLSRAGTPRVLEDLARHSMLVYTYANNPHQLRCAPDGATRAGATKGVVRRTDGRVLGAVRLKDPGLLGRRLYTLSDDIVAGRLVPVLDAWDLPRLTVNLASPSRKHLTAKVRTFID